MLSLGLGFLEFEVTRCTKCMNLDFIVVPVRKRSPQQVCKYGTPEPKLSGFRVKGHGCEVWVMRG